MMDKKNQVQVLGIKPHEELVFQGKDPETGISHSNIELFNPSSKRVCFKVKTTAPKRYCVRPNSGILKPLETISVDVMLPPSNASDDEKSKHKFMVQSIIVPDDNTNTDCDSIWKSAVLKDIMDCKLKCVFLFDKDQTNQVSSSGQGLGTAVAAVSSSSSSSPPGISENSVGGEGGVAGGGAAGVGQQHQMPGRGVDSGDSGVTQGTGSSHPTQPSVPSVGITHQPPTSGGDTSETSHHDMNKLQELIQQLRHETSSLRSENEQLREEQSLRQRRQVAGQAGGAAGAAATPGQKPAAAATTANVFPPLIYIILAAIFGIIIGKFVLP